MALHRRAAKRDANEPAIVSALEALGCVVWRVSGKGLPDLVVFYRKGRDPRYGVRHRTFVADVKGPRDGPTPAQVETWTALTNLGFSVFILRTPEDAQKMLNNALQPWEPSTANSGEGVDFTTLPGGWKKRHRCGKNGCRRLRPCATHDDTETQRRLMADYTPPRSTPVDAAKEAEATFAPPPFQHHSRCTYEGGGLCSCPAGWKG